MIDDEDKKKKKPPSKLQRWETRLEDLLKIKKPNDYHKHQIRSAKIRIKDIKQEDLNYFATFLSGLPDGDKLKEDLLPLYNDKVQLQPYLKTIEDGSKVTLHKNIVNNVEYGNQKHGSQASAGAIFKQIVYTHFGNSRGDKNKSVDQRVTEAITYATELWKQGEPTGADGSIPGTGIFRRKRLSSAQGRWPIGTVIYQAWEDGEPTTVPETIDKAPGHIIGFGLESLKDESDMKGNITETDIENLIENSKRKKTKLYV